MNLQALAADIAARVPDLARDCQENRFRLILGLLENERDRAKKIRDEKWDRVVKSYCQPESL